MSENFENINSRMPDLGAVLAQRIAARNAEATGTTPPGVVDPYQVMLQKKREDANPDLVDTTNVVKWPDADIKKLTDYCAKAGIVGFNCGRMHPIAALSMLKQQFGDFSEVPLEERVPAGYQKMGTRSEYSATHPYGQSMNKKQILHG